MSSKRIKGITVEIGGDTTKLDKALESSNKTLSQTQKALKDVERLLKLDPDNTELLAQKQRLLAEAAQASADKLGILQEAGSNADAALQRRDLLLHRVKRRIGKTGIEKAVGLQIEQLSHLLRGRVFERCALHVRHHARLAVARLVAGVNAGCVDMIHNPRSFSYRVTDFSAFYV